MIRLPEHCFEAALSFEVNKEFVQVNGTVFVVVCQVKHEVSNRRVRHITSERKSLAEQRTFLHRLLLRHWKYSVMHAMVLQKPLQVNGI